MQKTALNASHRALKARMVDFAGWDMPVLYEGVVPEHQAVREQAGLFDVSHMGEFHVEGPGAVDLIQRITPNNVAKLKTGRAHYSAFLTDDATYVDDLLVYRLADDKLMLVVNAANLDKDWDWLVAARDRECGAGGLGDVALHDASADMSLISVQGPAALAALEPLTTLAEGGEASVNALADLRYYAFVQGPTVAGHLTHVISRTGYTGEDGFEIYLPHEAAVPVWDALLASDVGVKPIGLGARDTLRLEAGMCLYGNDIGGDTTPVEAGLTWTVKMKKGDFVGRSVIARQMEEGASRRLVGLEVLGRGIARQGYTLQTSEGADAGVVTSGTQSPTLGKPVAMAMVSTEHSALGSELNVMIRSKAVPVRVVELPFYSRKKG